MPAQLSPGRCEADEREDAWAGSKVRKSQGDDTLSYLTNAHQSLSRTRSFDGERGYVVKTKEAQVFATSSRGAVLVMFSVITNLCCDLLEGGKRGATAEGSAELQALG